MEQYYFLSHPNLSVTAVVEAPSTDKARTAFLDYLERHGQVNRRQRREWRSNMGTKRVKDPMEVSADVRLDYELGNVSTLQSAQESVEREGEEYSPDSYSVVPSQQLQEPTQQVSMSPLQKVTLTGRL